MLEIKVVISWEKIGMSDLSKLKDKHEDSGVYMISGFHPVFGDDSLLYIGQTKEQTFGDRFKQHKKWMKSEGEEGNLLVYVGRVFSINDDEDYKEKLWENIIEDVEALLIYFHTPPYNSRSVDKFPEPKNDLRIINIGDYGDLYPEISHVALRLDDSGIYEGE